MTATVDVTISPLLDARTRLAAAIESATGYQCHASFENAIATPCYVLQPNGWVALAIDNLVAYRVQLTALYANQSGDLGDGVEELARLAYIACADFGAKFIEVAAPGSVTIGTTDYAGVQFEVTLGVTIREI